MSARPFTIYPAVDILGGRCVRLRRGDPTASTVYYDDPADAAARWRDEGAEILHVVDLDATLGTGRNPAAVERVVGVGVPVQLAGGIRDAAAADEAWALGAARIVLGTAAVEHPDLVAGLAQAHPGRVVLAADVRGGEVTVKGWTEGAGITIEDLLRQVASPALAGLLVTDVERDGVATGPAVELYRALAALTTVPVIASGGVSSVADIAAVKDAGAAGVVVGTALYTDRFTLGEALAAAR